MRIALCFPHRTNFHARFLDSLFKYKPDWVEVVERNPDVVMGLYGFTTEQPHWRFISPKVLFLERAEREIIETLSEKDIIFVYNPDLFNWIREVNPDANVFMERHPVDPDKFRLENRSSRLIDLLITGTYHDDGYSLRVYEAAGGPLAVVLGSIDYMPSDLVFCDYCHPNTEDDRRLVGYYNSAKMIISIHTEPAFELSYAEALFCGCRPLAPDISSFRWVYGDLARYFRLEKVYEDIPELIRDYEPVSDEEIEKAHELFAAPRVWGRIWGRIKEVLG